MNKNSREKLIGIALAVGAGICLTFPALANDSTAKTPETVAQGTSGSQSTSTNSRGVSSQYRTGQKQSQAIKDTNALPGGWLCLNNPNSQCIEQSRSK